MTYLKFIVCALGLVPTILLAQGTFSVRFEQSQYFTQPGQPLPVRVLMDPASPDGLFSFGVRLLWAKPGVQVSSESAIVLPSALDFGGPLGAGAIKAIGPGFAAVKGSVSPVLLPPQPYTDSTLVTFILTDSSALEPQLNGEPYEIKLELYRTLGPSETLFVSGSGEPLDQRIVFGSALVNIIPEPSTSWLFVLGGLACWQWFGRRAG